MHTHTHQATQHFRLGLFMFRTQYRGCRSFCCCWDVIVVAVPAAFFSWCCCCWFIYFMPYSSYAYTVRNKLTPNEILLWQLQRLFSLLHHIIVLTFIGNALYCFGWFFASTCENQTETIYKCIEISTIIHTLLWRTHTHRHTDTIGYSIWIILTNGLIGGEF